MGFFSRLYGKRPAKDSLLERNHAWFRSLEQKRPLTDFEFVAFDTELTGLNSRKDEIIAIGGVRIRGMQIITGETFHAYIRPQRYPESDHTFIHRITPEQLKEAPSIVEVLPEFVTFVGPALMVAHHVGLDMGFLNRAARQCLGGKLANPCLDTLRLAQLHTEKSWQQYHDRFAHELFDLESLSGKYGLPPFPRHDALQDALQTAYLFLYLAKKLEGMGLMTLHDLYTEGQSWKSFA